MKSSSGSRALGAALLVAALAGALPARAADVADGFACLDASDLPCAQEVAAALGEGPEAARLRASLAFHMGDFGKALALLKQANTSEPRVAEELALYQATVEATDGFAREKRGDVEIQYLPGTDLVLLDEAFETLQAAHDRIAPLLGGAPPGGVRMEIYPTGARFTQASGLPPEAVQTTGVVALSKWTRLLVTSPRALGRGYGWKDTIAHEYIHYVVSWRTQDRAPVWLQEGIARSHESLWRSMEPPPLQPFQQSLLADALTGNGLVPLERMHPSMAFLDSAEQAALAFAQVSTMVTHLRDVAGVDAVSRALEGVRGGADALQAVANVGSAGDVTAFMEAWKASLARMDLVSKKLHALPTVLGPAEDDFGLDPVLAQRRDLAGHARLGDLLRDAKRYEAALVEYRKAMPEDEPPSPTLSARVATTLRLMGRDDEAVATLTTSVADYPEFPLTRKLLGELFLAKGKRRDALEQYRASADVNPFDPEVQAALADLYGATGDRALAARHARYRRILDLGGADPKEKDG